MDEDSLVLSARASTGIQELDHILEGGFPRNGIYTLFGESGAGKTTAGLLFLLEGAQRGERSVYISFLQSRQDLEATARSHGWNLKGIQIEDPASLAQTKRITAEQTIFHTIHVELVEIMTAIHKVVERTIPHRLVLDAISDLRLLTDSSFRYKRQLIALKRFLEGRQTTVILLCGHAPESDTELQSMVDGVIVLEQRMPVYGRVRRCLHVKKLRASSYLCGYHEFRITRGEVRVYPRLGSDRTVVPSTTRVMKTDIEELDSMLGGGLETGSACLITGPSGAGKSSLAALYAYSAARRGEPAAIFLFDENLHTYTKRAKGLGMDMQPLVQAGLIQLHLYSIGQITPAEFTYSIRRVVEEDKASVVVIDCLTGYYTTMVEERFVLESLHELLAYTGSHSVLTLLTLAQYGLLGEGAPTRV